MPLTTTCPYRRPIFWIPPNLQGSGRGCIQQALWPPSAAYIAYTSCSFHYLPPLHHYLDSSFLLFTWRILQCTVSQINSSGQYSSMSGFWGAMESWGENQRVGQRRVFDKRQFSTEVSWLILLILGHRLVFMSLSIVVPTWQSMWQYSF